MKKIIDLLRNEARLNDLSRRTYTILATFIFPTLIALVSAFNNTIPGIILFFIIVGLALLQLWFGGITLTGAQSVQAAYFEMRDVHNKCEELSEQSASLLKQVNHLNYLQATIRAWGKITTQARHNKITNYDDLSKEITDVLNMICDKPGELFGCDADEWWNIAVYLYDSDSQVLFSIWRQKHRSHPSQEVYGRSWRPGEGHIGKAFADRASKITKDAHDPDVSELMAPPRADVRHYDDKAYRSYASVPFFDPLGRSPEPLGVIVATSNYKERFDKFNTLILQHASIVIADLVAMLDTPVGDIRKRLLPPPDPTQSTDVVGLEAPAMEATNGSA